VTIAHIWPEVILRLTIRAEMDPELGGVIDLLDPPLDIDRTLPAPACPLMP
jgi:hypothetical protein